MKIVKKLVMLILNGGCLRHITGDRALLSNIQMWLRKMTWWLPLEMTAKDSLRDTAF